MKLEYEACEFVIQQCPLCGDNHEMPLTSEQYEKLPHVGHKLIQELYPEMTPCEREFIKNGYCPKCQEMMFGNGKTKLIRKRA